MKVKVWRLWDKRWCALRYEPGHQTSGIFPTWREAVDHALYLARLKDF